MFSTLTVGISVQLECFVGNSISVRTNRMIGVLHRESAIFLFNFFFFKEMKICGNHFPFPFAEHFADFL